MRKKGEYRQLGLRFPQHRAASAAEFIRQIRVDSAWQPDWSEPDGAEALQFELAEFFESLRPDLIVHLFVPRRVSISTFLRMMEQWRESATCAYSFGRCPSRKLRFRFEYILVLEVGAHPKKTFQGHLHGHALVWNLGRVPQSRLAALWRRIAGIKGKGNDEPHIRRFQPAKGGTRYLLKESGTHFDQVFISDGLPKLVKARLRTEHAR